MPACPELVLFAPAGRWLALVADGWRLPSIVEPADVGGYSLILSRNDEPAALPADWLRPLGQGP